MRDIFNNEKTGGWYNLHASRFIFRLYARNKSLAVYDDSFFNGQQKFLSNLHCKLVLTVVFTNRSLCVWLFLTQLRHGPCYGVGNQFNCTE